MMDDKKLDDLLNDAVRSYRPPPEAPLDAIWARVEAEAFAAPAARRAPSWRAFSGAIAATLVFGVLIGNLIGVLQTASVSSLCSGPLIESPLMKLIGPPQSPPRPGESL